MDQNHQESEYSQFIPHKNLISIRGYIMLVVGTLISIGSILNADVGMLSSRNSWLPMASLVLILVGLIEAFDTYTSKHTPRFLVNLQIALLDIIFGMILFFGLSYSAANLSILIAAFLMIKGLFRMISAYMDELFNTQSMMIGGGISLLLGMIAWFQWPMGASVGFVSFALSVEIALRGWASVQFAQYLGKLARL